MNSRFRLQIRTLLRYHSAISNFSIPGKARVSSVPTHQLTFCSSTNDHKPASIDDEALQIQNLLKTHSHESAESIARRLDGCNPSLSEGLALDVLKRHRSDWKSAYTFFRWLCGAKNSTPQTSIYNEILDILGRTRRFDELFQLLDEMPKRRIPIDEQTYSIVLRRLAASHKVDEAIKFFDNMEDLGLERDLTAFQRLLLALCRYKHVEMAESLFRRRRTEFVDDIKTWNIILNGWCVLRSLPDAKRFWRDILESNCSPDQFTYGILINSLCKCGKAARSMELLRKMWGQGFSPDVTICNTVIDGLCFKKRIPEALEIFREMGEKGCPPNSATYNTLIKNMCKIQRMEVVDELVKEMEAKGGECMPNATTYNHLLGAAKNAEGVDEILERMEERGCEVGADTCNMVLRLYVRWGDGGRRRWIWEEMERRGVGPDRRSYAIVVHGLCDRGEMEGAMEYYAEMVGKGMEPEARTKALVGGMRSKLDEEKLESEIGLRNGKSASVKKRVKKNRYI